MELTKIKYTDLHIVEGFNHRTVDLDGIPALAANIGENGLFDPIKVHPGEKGYHIIDGERRYRALGFLRENSKAHWKKAFADDLVPVFLVPSRDEGTQRDISVSSNTHRQALTPSEVYAEVMKQLQAGKDQYETAALMNIQQPRVAEMVTFQRVIPEGHKLWNAQVLSHSDMLRLAKLEDNAQEAWITALCEDMAKAREGLPAADADASAKKAKAKARRDLAEQAAEAGTTRQYANAGKPSRKTLATLLHRVQVQALEVETDLEKAFYNGMAAAMKVANGGLDPEKVSATKSYVTKKEAAESAKVLAGKAEKPAKEEKPEKAEKPAKAPAKKPAKKAPAKKAPAKKKPAKKKPAKKPVKKPAKKAAAAEA